MICSPDRITQPFAFAQDVTIFIVAPGEEAVLARVAVLLGSWVEDEVAGERGSDEDDRMSACDVAQIGGTRAVWRDELEAAARHNHHPKHFCIRVNYESC